MYLLHAHSKLGNDTHVRAMENNFKYFLHVALMYFLQLLIQENIRHACILLSTMVLNVKFVYWKGGLAEKSPAC